MKRTLLAAILSSLLTAMLLTAGGSHVATVHAQNDAEKSNIISRVRAFSASRIALHDEGQAITSRWNALGGADVFADNNSDFVGANAGYTKAQMVSVITSIAADAATYAAGHGTNYNKFK